MPTVGWSAVNGHGVLGVHEVGSGSGPPSMVVTDMTAHGPLSPPAIVVPVTWSVARIGSRLNSEYGEDTSVQVTAGGVAVLLKVIRAVLVPAMYMAAPLFQLTPTEG